MGNLNDLGTTPIKDEVDVENLPEQMGGFAPPPQPGAYRWQLPRLTSDHFEKVETKDHGDRVQVIFAENNPLVILQSSDATVVGDPFTTRLSNVPRRRGKGDDAPVASDWDYLNRALKMGGRPASNMAYAQTLIEATKTGEANFGADLEWSWYCNDKRAARWDDGEGGSQEVMGPDGTTPLKGCGKRHYQNSVSKVVTSDDEGNAVGAAFPLRITCSNEECGATVRAFANLTRFRE